MKLSVFSPEFLKLVQSGEQFGTGVVSILVESLVIRLNGIFSNKIVKLKVFTLKSPPVTSCENTLTQSPNLISVNDSSLYLQLLTSLE